MLCEPAAVFEFSSGADSPERSRRKRSRSPLPQPKPPWRQAKKQTLLMAKAKPGKQIAKTASKMSINDAKKKTKKTSDAEDVHRHSAEEQKSTLSSVEDVSMSDIMLADLMPHVRKSVESLTALNETVREEMVHPAGVPRYVAEYAVEVLNALKPLTDQIAYLQKLAGSIDTMSDLVDEDDPVEAPASKHLREAPGG